MRIGIISYPTLFQQEGGLQVQVRATLTALRDRGIDARIPDFARERLESFDVVHVFAANNGNHRIVEAASAKGVPIVCSPLIRPHWTSALGRRARLADALVARLTRWEVNTEYRHFKACLDGADLLLALGRREQRNIIDAFHIPAQKVRIVPNGVSSQFFQHALTDEEHAYVAEPFVLCVATVSPHKNQATLAEATRELGLKLILVGPVAPGAGDYLDHVTAYAHVSYLGAMLHDDPRLIRLYATASVFALTSATEVMPLSALEALASGTPVVMTRHHGMDTTALTQVLTEVEPNDPTAIRDAIKASIKKRPSRALCRQLVQHMTWPSVAAQIVDAYEHVSSRNGRVENVSTFTTLTA